MGVELEQLHELTFWESIYTKNHKMRSRERGMGVELEELHGRRNSGRVYIRQTTNEVLGIESGIGSSYLVNSWPTKFWDSLYTMKHKLRSKQRK